MKRSLFAIVLSLALLSGCSTTAVPPPTAPVQAAAQPAAVPVALAATAQSKLVVRLTDCNDSIAVTEAEGGKLSFSGNSKAYSYAVSGPVNGVTTVSITQRKDAHTGTLTVPMGVYSAIRVELKGSAAALRPVAANYEVDGKDSALSILVPHDYAGKLSGQLSDTSLSFSVSGQMKNFSLSFGVDDCALSVPDAWNYKQGSRLVFSRGTGGAKLELSLKNCAVSVEERTLGYDSRYEGTRSAASMSTSSSDLEMLFGDGWDSGWSGSEFSKWRTASKPNTLTAISTIPAKGITGLRVNANLCALVLERSTSGKFELAYQGVEDVRTISVTTAVKDGLLTVTAEGTLEEYLYLSAAPNRRVNCVRLLVPEAVLKTLTVDCGEGIIVSNGLALPTVSGGAIRGIVSLKTGTVSAPITLSTGNGDLTVKADTISAAIAMETSNGGAEVEAGTVSGGVTLTTKNGDVELDAGTSTGKLILTARNGCVDADVKNVKDAEFRATNGDVDVTLGTVTGNTTCAVTNGTLEVELTKRPANLTFHIGGGWEENRWDGDWDDDWDDDKDWDERDSHSDSLPSGWYDGLVLGNGKPTLTLSAASNGDLTFKAPKISVK